jgi:ARG and Rhodanese-Phosphatase-superfamily-associated Protein domain
LKSGNAVGGGEYRLTPYSRASTGARPVFVMEGEEVVGAKQNRTINLSILVPAQAEVIAPVTCVEAGRWHARSAQFAASSRTHFTEARAAKSDRSASPSSRMVSRGRTGRRCGTLSSAMVSRNYCARLAQLVREPC